MTTQINITSEAAAQPQATSIVYSRLLWVAPLAMLAATVANLGLYAAAGSLSSEVTAWPGASVGQIIGATIMYLLVGTAVFAGVSRLSARPARNYVIVATIGLVASLWLPISAGMGFGAPDMVAPGAATVITLCLMHLLSYAISVPMYIRLALD